MSLRGILAMDTITVQEPVGSTDDSGGYLVLPWSTIATGPGRVDDASPQIREQFAAQGATVTHTVFTEISTIKAGHRILTSDGLILFVEGCIKNRGILTIPTYYTIACRRVAT